MKRIFSMTLIIFMVTGLLFSLSPGGSNDFIEFFEIQETFSLNVAVESGWERDGLIPVVLSFGDLELTLYWDALDLAAAAGNNYAEISNILFGVMTIPLDVYEQGPMRTRMRLIDKNEPVILKINPGKKQAEFYVGSRRLKLDHIEAAYKDITDNGLYQLTFEGDYVNTYSGFILEPAAGIIYAVPLYLPPGNLNLDKCPVWARKIEDWQIKRKMSSIQGEIK